MAKKKPQRDEPMQRTTPKKGEPIEIPIPKRKDVLDALRKVAKPSSDRERRPEK